MSDKHDENIEFDPAISPYACNSQRYIDHGLPVIPIEPGKKRPGLYVRGKWYPMAKWQEYSKKLPTAEDVELWQAWPEAGIGLLLGPMAGIIAVDVDTEDEYLLKKINEILPPSPVRKKGKKGWTSFYRFSGEVNKSWRVSGKPVIDLLCEGRQTLMPGTIHPDGMTYVWITEDTLDTFDFSHLPELPRDFNELMAQMIEPMMNEDDRRHLRHQNGPEAIEGERPTSGFAASYFREINTQALYHLDEWVPKLIPTAKANANGYRCKAFWRNAENLNVGISRQGIRDFGGDYGMTAIDLVMYAQNVPFPQAAEALRNALGIVVEEPSFQLGKPAVPPPPVPKVHGPNNEIDLMLATRGDKLFKPDVVRQEPAKTTPIPDFILQAPGMLGRVVGWMAETAPKYQPELFLAATIALGAAVMGRLYRTTYGNWSSLYVIMVAKSGEGKEHPQQSVLKILSAAGLGRLVAGSGYTSPGAVHSALMRAPSHIAVMDEIGKLLKLSRSHGAANAEAAIDKLVEAYTKVDSFMKPAEYSRMSLTKEKLELLGDLTVHNPAITLLGATTPATLYETLEDDLVTEGFLGRVFVVQSTQGRQETVSRVQTPPPEDIVEWVRDIANMDHIDLINQFNPATPATPTIMVFDSDADRLLADFDKELMYELKPQYEATNLDSLLARTREKAMRLSMIVAKATNVFGDNVIHADAVEWAIKYAKFCDLQTIQAVQAERSETPVERQIKKIISYINGATDCKDPDEGMQRVLAAGGMPRTRLLRAMKLDRRAFDILIDTAIEQGRISMTQGLPSLGYAGIVYWPRS